MEILLWAIPVFGITMLLEQRLTLAPEFKGYWPKDAATNLSMGIGNLVVKFGAKAGALAIYMVITYLGMGGGQLLLNVANPNTYLLFILVSVIMSLNPSPVRWSTKR